MSRRIESASSRISQNNNVAFLQRCKLTLSDVIRSASLGGDISVCMQRSVVMLLLIYNLSLWKNVLEVYLKIKCLLSQMYLFFLIVCNVEVAFTFQNVQQG